MDDIDGTLRDVLSRPPADGVEVVQELRYLTVGDNEFTYGFMNGMRPRGMLLNTMRRVGDHFEGQQRWGGVKFRLPDGGEPPTMSVTLRKVR